jgi:tape measure domain-containing protein
MKGVEIQIRADATKAKSEIKSIGTSVQNLEKQAERLSNTFKKLAVGITAAFGAAAGGGAIVKAADQMAGFRNRINLVTRDAAKTEKVLGELFKVAADARTDIGLAADTFNRFGLALQDSNKPVDELLKVTKAVSQASIISGASAESAKAALVQLGQGLSSGELRGEELNSVLEQTPRLARTIAKGMKIPFGQLRAEAKAGKLVADEVYAAILEGAQELDDEFKLMQATVGDLATVFKNELTRTISNFDDALGITDRIKTKLVALTDIVRSVGTEIKFASLAIKANFAIILSNVKFFVQDVAQFFKDIFNPDISNENLVNRMKGAIDGAKEAIKNTASIALTFTVAKLDLAKNFFFGDGDVLTRVNDFVTAIIDGFYTLWERIVGKSLFLGIFMPNHKEAGQDASIGDVGVWGKFLTIAEAFIGSTLARIGSFFESLHNTVMAAWAMTTAAISGEELDMSSLPDNVQFAIWDIQMLWSDLTKFFRDGVNGIKSLFEEGGLFEGLPNTLLFTYWKLQMLWSDIKVLASDAMKGIQESLESTTWYKPLMEAMTFLKFSLFLDWLNIKTIVTDTWDELTEYIMSSPIAPVINFVADTATAGMEAVQGAWEEVTNFVNNHGFTLSDGGISGFASVWKEKAVEMEIAWFEFTNHVDKHGLNFSEEQYKAFATGFGAQVQKVKDAYDSVQTHIDANGLNLSPTQKKSIETQFDEIMQSVEHKFNSSAIFINKNTGLSIPAYDQIVTSLEEKVTKAKDVWTGFSTFIQGTLPFAVIKVVFDKTGEKIKLGDEIIDDLIANFKENEDRIAAGLAIAITAGMRLGFSNSFKVAGALIFGGDILNSDAFQTSVGKLAKGAGELINDAFSEEGSSLDVGADIFSGLDKTMATIGEAFLDGLFGPEFENAALEKLAGALIAIMGLSLFSSRFLSILKYTGGLIASTMFGDSFKDKAKAVATKSMKGLGLAAGVSLAIDFGGDALLDAFGLSENEVANFGKDMASNMASGAATGGAIGSFVPVIGTAIGAAIGAAIGGIVTLVQYKDLLKKWQADIEKGFSDGWEWLKGAIVELPTLIGNAMLEGFQTAWNWLSEKLEGVKDFFTFGGSEDDAGNKQQFSRTAGERPNKEINGVEHRWHVGIGQWYPTNSPVFKKAEGGPIFGAGGPTDDKIPAMLSNGEYVIKASAAKKLGMGTLDKLNRGMIPKFATGGAVGSIVQSFSGGGSPQTLAERLEPIIARLNAQMDTANRRGDFKEFARLADVLEELTGATQESIQAMNDGTKTAEEVAADAAAAGGGSTGADVETVGEQYANGLRNAFNSGLAEAIKDGDFKGFGMSMLDQVTGSIMDAGIQGFTSALTDSLFGDEGIDNFFDSIFGGGEKAGGKSGGLIKSLFGGGGDSDAEGEGEAAAKPFMSVFDGFGEKFKGILDGFGGNFKGILGGLGSSLSGLFGGGGGSGAGIGGMLSGLMGGGGGGMGSLLTMGMGFLGFNSGGTVPATPYSQAGKDSVPAMLTPGEVVLSRKQLGGMTGMANQATQSFNINVQGDVSRQTRKEIVKMMPEISGGVNKTNKENNYKR